VDQIRLILVERGNLLLEIAPLKSMFFGPGNVAGLEFIGRADIEHNGFFPSPISRPRDIDIFGNGAI